MIARYRIHPNMFMYDRKGNVILWKNAYEPLIQSGIIIQHKKKNYAKALNTEKIFRLKNIVIKKVNYNTIIRLIDIVLLNNNCLRDYSTVCSLVDKHANLYKNVEELSCKEIKNIEEFYNRNYKELIRETTDAIYISGYKDNIDPLVLEIDDRVMLKLKLITDEQIFVHQYDENVIRCLTY